MKLQFLLSLEPWHDFEQFILYCYYFLTISENSFDWILTFNSRNLILLLITWNRKTILQHKFKKNFMRWGKFVRWINSFFFFFCISFPRFLGIFFQHFQDQNLFDKTKKKKKSSKRKHLICIMKYFSIQKNLFENLFEKKEIVFV